MACLDDDLLPKALIVVQINLGIRQMVGFQGSGGSGTVWTNCLAEE